MQRVLLLGFSYTIHISLKDPLVKCHHLNYPSTRDAGFQTWSDDCLCACKCALVCVIESTILSLTLHLHICVCFFIHWYGEQQANNTYYKLVCACVCFSSPSWNGRLSIQPDLFLNCLVWALSLLISGTAVSLKWLLTPNCLWQNLTLPVAADNPQTHIWKRTFNQRCVDTHTHTHTHKHVRQLLPGKPESTAICSSMSLKVVWKYTYPAAVWLHCLILPLCPCGHSNSQCGIAFIKPSAASVSWWVIQTVRSMEIALKG